MPPLTIMSLTSDGIVVIPVVFFKDERMLLGVTYAEEAEEDTVLLRVLGDIVCLLGAGKLEIREVLGNLELLPKSRNLTREKANLYKELQSN